jgi:hypothetical protein
VAGGVLAWLTISSEVLESEPGPGGDLPTGVLNDFSCAVAGPPLRPGWEAECHPIAVDLAGSNQLPADEIAMRRSGLIHSG